MALLLDKHQELAFTFEFVNRFNHDILGYRVSLNLKIKELPSTCPQCQNSRIVLAWVNIVCYSKMFDFYYILSLLFYVQEKHLNKVCFQRGKKGCWHAGELTLL